MWIFPTHTIAGVKNFRAQELQDHSKAKSFGWPGRSVRVSSWFAQPYISPKDARLPKEAIANTTLWSCLCVGLKGEMVCWARSKSTTPSKQVSSFPRALIILLASEAQGKLERTQVSCGDSKQSAAPCMLFPLWRISAQESAGVQVEKKCHLGAHWT